MFKFYSLPVMFFGVQEIKGTYILFSFSGSALLPDEKCSIISRIVWKGSTVYKWIEVSLHCLFVVDDFVF